MKVFRYLHRALGVKGEIIFLLASTWSASYEKMSNYLGLPKFTNWEVFVWCIFLILTIAFFKRIYMLEGKIEPTLAFTDITYDTEPAIEDIFYGNTGNIEEKQSHSFKTCRIHIKNTGNDHLDKCHVQLVGLEDSNKNRRTKFLPIGLSTEHQTHQERTGRFSLSAGQEKIILVASYNEKSGNVPIALRYEQPIDGEQYPNTIPSDLEWHLTIEAYGAASPVSKQYKLFVNDDGCLILEDFGEV